MEDLSAAVIERRKCSGALSRRVLVLAETTSTMTVAAEMVATGAPEGLVVVADYQTAGRGRLDHAWHSPPGAGLLMSVVLRPNLPADRLTQVPMAAGLACLDAVAAHVPDPLRVELKWPNDVLVAGLKIGGLIADTVLDGRTGGHVVLGVGINVRQGPAELPSGATSFAALGLQPPRRDELAAGLLDALEERYGALAAGKSLRESWAKRLATIGCCVRARTPQGELSGTAVGVDELGGLLLALADGTTTALYAGDVTLLGPPGLPPAGGC